MSSYENVVFQSIYKIAMYGSIVPKWDFSRNKPNSFHRAYYRYLFLIVMVLILLQILYETLLSLRKNWNANDMVTCTSAIAVTSWVLLNFNIIWNSSNDKWFYVLKILSETSVKKSNFKFNDPLAWTFLIGLILLLTIVIVDGILFDFSILYTLADATLLFELQIYSSVMFNILMVLRTNFKDVLRELKQSENFVGHNQDMKMLQRRYLRNFDACDVLNELSGPTFLLITASSSIQLLFCVNLLTLFAQSPESSLLSIFIFIYGFVNVQYSLGTILACHLVKKEAKLIVRQCYKQLEAPMLSESRKSELLTFAMVANNNLPEFTAWGFFKLRRSTILSLLNTTATYMIVAYQFRRG